MAEKMFYHQLVSVRDVVEMLLNCTHKAQFCLSAIFWTNKSMSGELHVCRRLMHISVNVEHMKFYITENHSA